MRARPDPSFHPVALWVRHRNPGGLLYGALGTGAALALSSAVTDHALTVALTVLQVLVVFWLVHVYTRVVAERLASSEVGLVERTRAGLVHERAVLEGGVPALAVFVIAVLIGASTSTAADAGVVSTVVVLGSAGYVVGRRAGSSGRALAGEVAVAALFGIAMGGLKVALH